MVVILRCPYINQNGVQCGQPEGHMNEHGNGLLTQGANDWHLYTGVLPEDNAVIPPSFCLKASDPATPSLISLWIVSAKRIKVNENKIADAELKLDAIREYQRVHGTKVPD